MNNFAPHPLLSIEAIVIDIGSAVFMFWACIRLVGWHSPLRWLVMWLALLGGFFVGFSAYGPLHYGVFAGPSTRLWEPSLLGLAFSVAVATAGTIGVWRGNR